jgi:hypothetical protein
MLKDKVGDQIHARSKRENRWGTPTSSQLPGFLESNIEISSETHKYEYSIGGFSSILIRFPFENIFPPFSFLKQKM